MSFCQKKLSRLRLSGNPLPFYSRAKPPDISTERLAWSFKRRSYKPESVGMGMDSKSRLLDNENIKSYDSEIKTFEVETSNGTSLRLSRSQLIAMRDIVTAVQDKYGFSSCFHNDKSSLIFRSPMPKYSSILDKRDGPFYAELALMFNFSQRDDPEFNPIRALADLGHSYAASGLTLTMIKNYRKSESCRIGLIETMSKYLIDDIKHLPECINIMSTLVRYGGLYVKELEFWGGRLDVKTDSSESFMAQFTADKTNITDAVVTKYTSLLINLCLYHGLPLLATSVCIRFAQKRMPLTTVDIDNCIHSLTTLEFSRVPLGAKALTKLINAVGKNKLYLSSETKGQFILKAMSTTAVHSWEPPLFANELCEYLEGIPGEESPLFAYYQLIHLNIRGGLINKAIRYWNRCLAINQNILEHDTSVLSNLINCGARDRRYQKFSRNLIASIPESQYSVNEISESVLKYCQKYKDKNLTHRVYRRLKTPLSRFTMSLLLNVHLSFNDMIGADKILLEMKQRNESLSSKEIAMVSAAMARRDINEAVKYVQDNVTDEYDQAQSYISILNVAVDQNDDSFVAVEFPKLISTVFLTDNQLAVVESVILHKLCYIGALTTAQRLWQKLVSNGGKRSQMVGLNSMLDGMVQNQDFSILKWLLNEYYIFGMSPENVADFVKSRYKNRRPESQYSIILETTQRDLDTLQGVNI